MIAATALALENDDRGERGQLVGGSRAGDARADDHDVGRIDPVVQDARRA